MRFHKRLFITALIGLTGLGSVQAEVTINRVDARAFEVPAAAPKAAETGIYIVQMKSNPIIAYEGDVAGYKATKPGKGQKINRNNQDVKKYGAYLEKKQNNAIDSVGAEKVYSYRYALNGFAARMTAADADALRRSDDILNVWKNEIRYPQTDASPNYINITEGGEAWSNGYVGEDVVIGVIDTGVWPEHPSFADTPTPFKGNKGPAIPYSAPSGFTASGCDFGNTAANPSDAPFACNNKLVAARCYNMGQSSGPDASNPCGGDGIAQSGDAGTFQSARDDNGHGSHTASTAGGNNGVPAYLGGEFQGNVSGIAPRAHIAAYKVCWFDGGCASADSAMAIDDAVADGVDVINFSIGGSSNFFGSADDVAFLFAAADGVWVATSNGNDGPGAGTVGTPSGVPWITAVGATQDDGVFYNELVVNAPGSVAGNYTAVEGDSDVTLADTGPITDDVTMVSGDGFACGGIDPIDGIALVSRGGCAFSDKYNNAEAAGAVAIIVFNDGANAGRIDPIVMSAPGTNIPGVMIGYFDGIALAAESGVNATMDDTNSVSAANRIAGFSSRGPNNGALDIIKPDVSAPGVAILAAASPPANGGGLFMSINGTSMASPHVAGSFALLKQAHPDWSAAEARSALMTTARNGLLKTFGTAPADPFDVGAGEIQPSDAFDPGLAYDAGLFEYAAFTCENNVQLFTQGSCDFLESIGVPSDGSDLNLPSIGIGDLVGEQTVTRTVNAVYNNNGNKTFHVSVDAPAGIDVSVSPSTIKLLKGNSASYEVTFTTTGAATLDEWAFGSLTWTDDDGNYAVRSPIAVRPTAFSAPGEVDGVADSSGDGFVDIPVAFGYEGDYSASVSGIEASGFGSDNITSGDGTHFWCVDLPAMTHFRVSMFDEDTSDPGADDLDLRVFIADADCVNATSISQLGSSGGATSEEAVDLSDLPAGAYFALVDYFSASNGTDSDYKIWFQPVFGNNGNTSVSAPASAVLGAEDTVTVDYTGLAPTRNLGVLHHMDGSGEIGRTILDIDAR
jgi:subtilisin family serine protease